MLVSIRFSLRYLAELLAGWAKCDLKQGLFEAANARACAALDMHATCGEAFLVRGQVQKDVLYECIVRFCLGCKNVSMNTSRVGNVTLTPPSSTCTISLFLLFCFVLFC